LAGSSGQSSFIGAQATEAVPIQMRVAWPVRWQATPNQHQLQQKINLSQMALEL
jgi:hypothetical protein